MMHRHWQSKHAYPKKQYYHLHGKNKLIMYMNERHQDDDIIAYDNDIGNQSNDRQQHQEQQHQQTSIEGSITIHDNSRMSDNSSSITNHGTMPDAFVHASNIHPFLHDTSDDVKRDDIVKVDVNDDTMDR